MVITDGRWDYLERTLQSAAAMLKADWCQVLIVNDSGEPLPPIDVPFDAFTLIQQGRKGLAGAIQTGWDNLGDCDYVFHLEDDWTFPDPVDVVELVDHLDATPTLAQVALLRQPWSPEEQATGSLYGPNKDAYTEYKGLVRHRRLFTFNPCVYPRTICDYGAGLEAEVTDTLKAKGYEFAYLGGLDDPHRCTHIGVRRSAGYRW